MSNAKFEWRMSACGTKRTMTQSIVEIAGPLGIAVPDHIIVGKGGHASFKALKLI